MPATFSRSVGEKQVLVLVLSSKELCHVFDERILCLSSKIAASLTAAGPAQQTVDGLVRYSVSQPLMVHLKKASTPSGHHLDLSF